MAAWDQTTPSPSWPDFHLGDPPPVSSMDSPSHSPPALAPLQPAKWVGTGQRHWRGLWRRGERLGVPLRGSLTEAEPLLGTKHLPSHLRAGSQHSATCWASQVGAGQPDSPSQALPPGQSGATPYQPQRLARAGRQEVEKTSGEHMLRLVRKEGVDGCLFTPQDPQAQAAYLAIPTLLKARTSRSCGETSAVLKDRKRGTENSTGKGWVMGFVRLIEDRGLAAMVMGREEVGRAILHRGPHCPFLPKTVGNQTQRFSHMLATASAKAGLASTPGQGPGPGQEPHRMGTPPPKSPGPSTLENLQP
ncbi:uncharacterized protein [Pseudorca crassidens]|uniref:uncharacterized protein n=1 Tax=Pseudorca crassidens TaxID=82174 RepID=UPI00352E6FEC